MPLQETVEGFAELVAEGTVGLLGASNHRAWRVERARALAAAAGLPGYEVLQYHRSYLPNRTDLVSELDPDGEPGGVGGDLLSYLRAEPELTLVAYSPLLKGAYTRADKPLSSAYDLPSAPGDWRRCGRWPGRAGRLSTRWCSPGCWAASCRPSRWWAPRRWRSWRRAWPRWTWS